MQAIAHLADVAGKLTNPSVPVTQKLNFLAGESKNFQGSIKAAFSLQQMVV